MAATVHEAPPTIIFAEDDNFVTLETDLVTRDAAQITLSLGSTGFGAGNELEIAWEGITLTFTAQTVPDNSGLEIPAKGVGESDTDHREAVIDYLRRNETLSDNWDIIDVVVGNAVRFRFREYRALTPTCTTDGTGMSVTIDPGSDPYNEENLRGVLQILTEDFASSEVTSLIKLEGAYNIYDSRTAYNLRNLMPVEPHLPDTDQIGAAGSFTYNFTVAQQAYKVYYLRYADKYGDPIASEGLQKYPAAFYALAGGSPGYSHRIFGTATGGYVCRTYPDSFRKPVAWDQPDWVYWFPDQTYLSQSVSYVAYYKDGTSDVRSVALSGGPLTVPGFQLYYLPCGPAQLGITDTDIWAYDFRVGQSFSSSYNLVIRYILEPDCHPWQKVIAFFNGLGGIETVAMRGKGLENYETAKDTFVQARWNDFTTDEGTLQHFNQQGHTVYEFNTGWISQEYAGYLRQLLLGPIWLVDQDNQRFLRLLANTDSINVQEDDTDEDLSNLTFVARVAVEDSHYHAL